MFINFLINLFTLPIKPNSFIAVVSETRTLSGYYPEVYISYIVIYKDSINKICFFKKSSTKCTWNVEIVSINLNKWSILTISQKINEAYNGLWEMKDERSSFLFAIKWDSEQINKLKGLLVLNYNLDIRSRMVWNGDKMNSLVVDKKPIWLIKSLKRCIVYSPWITYQL